MGMFDTPENASPNLDFENQDGNEVNGADNQSGTNVDTGRNPDIEQADQGQNQDEQKTPPDEGDGQQLILGKYKTQEDLIRAHESLQKRLGGMRNELGQLRTQVPQQQQAQGSSDSQEWTPEQWQKFNNQFKQEFLANPGQAVCDLVVDLMQQAIAPIQETFQQQNISQQNEAALTNELSLLFSVDDDSGQYVFPEIEQMTDQIEAFLTDHPYMLDMIIQQNAARASGQFDEGNMGVLDVIYRAVKAEAADAAGKQAYQNGLQQGARSVQTKTNVALGSPGARSQSSATPEEQIVSEIFAHKKGGFFG